MSSLSLRAAGVAFLSWLLLSLVTWSTPQGLHFYDPVVQLTALQQHERGESPAWNVWLRVDPSDLSRDIAEPVGWWPPSIPLLTHAVRTVSGMPLGSALRLLAIAAGAIGVIGWAVWWARFPLPAGWIFAVCALLPWVRHASSALFRFSGEILAFAGAPWIFLALASCLVRLRRGNTGTTIPALLGVAIGFSYWLKYSLFVTAFAALLGTLLVTLLGKLPVRGALRPLLALAFGMAAAPIALKFFHAGLGALDPAGRLNPANIGPVLALFFVANPVLGLADAAGPFFDALVYPGVAGLGGHNHAVLAWIGLPGGLLLAWLLAGVLRDAEASAPATLAAVTLPIFSILMLGLWLSSDVARDTRFFIPAAFAALPAVLSWTRRRWTHLRLPTRALLLVAAVVYLVVPLLYGPTYVALKITRQRDARPGVTHLALPSFATPNVAALGPTLRDNSRPDTVWIIENVEAALEITGRCLTPIAGRSIAEDMRNIYTPPATLAHWATTRPIRLCTLSTSRAEPPALLRTLRNIEPWVAQPTTVADVVLWTTTMQPHVRRAAPL